MDVTKPDGEKSPLEKHWDKERLTDLYRETLRLYSEFIRKDVEASFEALATGVFPAPRRAIAFPFLESTRELIVCMLSNKDRLVSAATSTETYYFVNDKSLKELLPHTYLNTVKMLVKEISDSDPKRKAKNDIFDSYLSHIDPKATTVHGQDRKVLVERLDEFVALVVRSPQKIFGRLHNHVEPLDIIRMHCHSGRICETLDTCRPSIIRHQEDYDPQDVKILDYITGVTSTEPEGKLSSKMVDYIIAFHEGFYTADRIF